MWSALFGSEEKGTLVLRPDASAVSVVSGFKGGAELRVAADAGGQTVGQVLEKFNKYRGPDQQIRVLWGVDGAMLRMETPLRGFTVGIVRAESVGSA